MTASDGTGSRTMTKEEAIAALLRGEKLTHRCFQTEEWMRLEHGKVIFEDGASIYWDTFWDDRRSEAWQTDWSIFTPIVPSPDSVKDMGEVTKHTPGPWYVNRKANDFVTDNAGNLIATASLGMSAWKANAELIAAAPATAARLEEALRENEELKKRILFFEGSGYLNYQKLVEQRDSLLKDVATRYTREQMQEAYERGGSYASSYEHGYPNKADTFPNFMKEIDADRGATEQSTEQ